MIKAGDQRLAGSEFKETTKVSMNVMEQFFDKSKSGSSKTGRENTTRVTKRHGLRRRDHGSAKFTELGYSMNYSGGDYG
ncbi:hypothetical protein O2313_11720 [Bacillus amyloliquefaciens]|uniref:hypothetical protein n=1 Tax=Bacillus amyloliquefaciens TaxID=1390 RepID=UPI0022AE8FDD|nr:hypothetical protein [Bacillus amyloliquefaciens]MCZ4248190.1 hypothetical protein [Bacillus amyloliquefaciens]